MVCAPPVAIPAIFLAGSIGNVERAIASGAFLEDSPILQWEGERRLFAQLKSYPELIGSDGGINAFYQDANSSSIATIFQVDEAIQQTKGVPSSMIEQLKVAQDGLIIKNETIYDKLSELRFANNLQDSIDLLLMANTLSTERQQTEAKILGSLLERIELYQSEQVALAQYLNSTLPEDNIWLRNRKRVNAIYLQTLAKDITTLSPAQFDQISEIANQCAYEGGSAVLEARILYQMHTPKQFSDDLLCIPMKNRSRASLAISTRKGDNVKLVPNPANDLVSIIGLTIPENEERTEIRMFNTQGVLVNSIHFDSVSLEISLKGIAEGVYICHIITDGVIISINKLIVIH